MTISDSDLAKKHNIDHESAKAFLQEWLDMQDIVCNFRINDFNEYAFDVPNFSNDEQYNYWVQTCGGKGTNAHLIARPTLGE